MVRRARVFVEDKKEWKYVQPSMSDWKSGKYESPLELKLVQKKTLDFWLNAQQKQVDGEGKVATKAAADVKPEKKAPTAAVAPTAMETDAGQEPGKSGGWCIVC